MMHYTKTEKEEPTNSLKRNLDISSSKVVLEDDLSSTKNGVPNEHPKFKLGKVKGHEARWNEMFNRLLRYRSKHGHCLVPNRYKEDPKLGTWVATQRRQYKSLISPENNDSTPITRERAMRLEKIGFEWSPKAMSSNELSTGEPLMPTTSMNRPVDNIATLFMDNETSSKDAFQQALSSLTGTTTGAAGGYGTTEMDHLLEIMRSRQHRSGQQLAFQKVAAAAVLGFPTTTGTAAFPSSSHEFLQKDTMSKMMQQMAVQQHIAANHHASIFHHQASAGLPPSMNQLPPMVYPTIPRFAQQESKFSSIVGGGNPNASKLDSTSFGSAAELFERETKRQKF